MAPVGAEKTAAKNSPLVAPIRDLGPALIDAVADCPLAMVEVRQLGGALGRAPQVPNAVSGRDASFQVFCAGVGGPTEAPLMHASIDTVLRGMKRWAIAEGTLNYLSARDTDPGSVRDAFGKDVHDRLAMVKRGYDPANLFRVNHNIPPIR